MVDSQTGFYFPSDSSLGGQGDVQLVLLPYVHINCLVLPASSNRPCVVTLWVGCIVCCVLECVLSGGALLGFAARFIDSLAATFPVRVPGIATASGLNGYCYLHVVGWVRMECYRGKFTWFCNL